MRKTGLAIAVWMVCALGLTLCWALIVVDVAGAQERPDSLESAAPDRVQNAPLVESKTALHHLLPGPAAQRRDDPAVFEYTFGALGWPDAISRFGQHPDRMPLIWDGRVVDDLVTGQPLSNWIPLSLIGASGWNEIGGLTASLRDLEGTEPETAVRYQSSGDGMQSIHALHIQNRLLGAPDSTRGRLQTILGYAGAGSEGEYDGSQLRRMRQIVARVGWQTERWDVTLTDVASRGAVGAHAGVIPFTGAGYESIYQRLGATVEDATARRRTIRNDLTLAATASVQGLRTESQLYRISQTLDFRGASLQTRGWLTRLGAQVSQTWSSPSAEVAWSGYAWQEGSTGGTAFQEDTSSRRQLGGQARGQWTRNELLVRGQAGLHAGRDDSWLDAGLSATHPVGDFMVEASASTSNQQTAWADQAGFGSTPAAGLPTLSGREDRFQAGLSWSNTVLRLGVTAHVVFSTDPLEYRRTDQVGIRESAVIDGRHSERFVSLEAGFRDQLEAGPYVAGSFTMRQAEADGASLAGTSWTTSWENRLPDTWANGRLGWKALLFQDDLDLDAYLRVRWWDSFTGRTIHTPTGQFVLSGVNQEPVASSWLVDVVAEAGVRGATLFFAYENMFSGTTTLIGNLVIPDYPLPRQRIRFGVFWPIAN